MSRRARTDRDQSRHDRKVQELAEEYNKKGYHVRADVKGYPRPESIGRKNPKRPDLFVSGHGYYQIIEVETKSSQNTKRAQVQKRKFKNWSYRKDNRKCEIITI